MILKRFQIHFCLYPLKNSKKCKIVYVLAVILLCFLLIIYYIRKPFHEKTQISNDFIIYNTPWNLLNGHKVLVPVHINHLYDYRVVCNDKYNGTLNQVHFIDRLSTICKVNFNGSLNINLNVPKDFQIRSESTLKYLHLWKPTNTSCSVFQDERIAIIISYRDREQNLKNLLYNLIPVLEQQKIGHYKIFVIEQQAQGPFNKGRLYNIGFNHVMKIFKPRCIIFHDADLIPENDKMIYSCVPLENHPLHMSANVRNKIDGTYTNIYSFLVGGVLMIRPETFTLINGYSNEYFSWGGEDDDMGLRFLSKDICVQRPKYGYFYAASHSQQHRNKNRFKLLFDAVLRQDTDGLSNIEQLASVINTYDYSLVTWINVTWIDRR